MGSRTPVWGAMNTIGFEMRLGADYQLQTQRMQLAEWWQGSHYGPPLELVLLPNSTTWAIGIENDDNNTQGIGDEIF